MIITSKDNEKLKTIRKLNARRRDREHLGLFVAEGEDLVQAAAANGWEPVELLCAEGSGLEGVEVEYELLKHVTELNSGTRQLGVYRHRWVASDAIKLASATADARVTVYLDGIGDPGNVGTILRSAAAFGAGTVVFGPGSADPYSPKAVRASMGAIFQVATAKGVEPAELPGVKIALDAGAELTLAAIAREIDGKQLTLIVGAEREGISEALLNAADHVAEIPIATESLNAAIAAAVALYELTRRIND